MTAEEYLVEELKETKEELKAAKAKLKVSDEISENLSDLLDEVRDYFQREDVVFEGDKNKYFYVHGYSNCYKEKSPRLYAFVENLVPPKFDSKVENLTYGVYCKWINAMGLSVRSTNCLCRFYSNQDRPEFHTFKEMLEWFADKNNVMKIRNLGRKGFDEIVAKAKEKLNEGE